MTVTDGKITLGAKNEENLNFWCIWDNFRLSYLGTGNPDDEELVAPEGWDNMIANGNLAGDNVSSFVSKEAPSADIVGSTIEMAAGKNYSRGIVVKSQDKVEVAWESQFWIKLSEALPAGSKLHVEFDYKADNGGSVGTQAHGEPGNYQHWAAIGNVNFTPEWQHFSADIEVSSDMATANGGNGLLSIAFNLNDIAKADTFYFDNFGVWAQKPVNVGIMTVEAGEKGEGIFNLSGQKVTNPTKGLYIINGKKVLVK